MVKEYTVMKRLFSIIFLLVGTVVLGAAQAVQLSKSDAVNIALNEILANKLEVVDAYISSAPVTMQKGLQVRLRTVRCPYSFNWVIFIDDHPFANWDHPCRYVFINRDKKEYTIVNEVRPPERLEDFEKINEAKLPSRPTLNLRKGGYPAAIMNAPPNPHYYAVIISGGYSDWYNYIRYWNDISATFCTLTQVYGYMPENIYVHSTDGTAAHNHGSLDLDKVGPPYTDDIRFPASKASITTTFQMLDSTIGPGDQLFVYVTDHGGTDANGSFIYLWDDEMLTSSELKEMLAPINASEIIVVMEQCFSGGFITGADNLTGSHRVVHTACSATEESWAEL
jgi:hypothetical protein